MTSKRQRAAQERALARMGERLAQATTAKERARLWFDEYRRRAELLPEPEREAAYEELTQLLKGATQRKRR